MAYYYEYGCHMPTYSELDSYVKSMNKSFDINIDRDTLMKLIRDETKRNEFDIREFPYALPWGIIPGYRIVQQRETKPQQYEEIMDLASLAIAKYNQDNRTQFKVVKIENVNKRWAGVGRLHYITFSAVQVKSSKPEEIRTVESKIWQILRGLIVEFRHVLTSFGRDLEIQNEKLKEKLKRSGALDWKATQDEIQDETAVCKTFQAKVINNILEVRLIVEFCAAVDERKSKVPGSSGSRERQGEQVRMCLRNLTQNYKDDCAKGKVALETLLACVTNVGRDYEEKFRKIACAEFQDPVGKLKGGIEFLEACGYEKVEGGKFLYLPKEKDTGVFYYAGWVLYWTISNVAYSGWFIYDVNP